MVGPVLLFWRGTTVSDAGTVHCCDPKPPIRFQLGDVTGEQAEIHVRADRRFKFKTHAFGSIGNAPPFTGTLRGCFVGDQITGVGMGRPQAPGLFLTVIQLVELSAPCGLSDSSSHIFEVKVCSRLTCSCTILTVVQSAQWITHYLVPGHTVIHYSYFVIDETDHRVQPVAPLSLE